ncbi:MAG: 16S rRNA (cytidine(1402)-2'-O)-methyltransferase [Deltaproteobacteria bacterium]|nr:16S rRNA (cytidine(1402)-2'-O)-methyltransferase [Deltaproteobacteria bacterium]
MPSRTHESGDARSARTDRPARPDSTGRLWVVAAPLGNPDDLSPRARSVLAAADVVLAEDTRSARRILSLAGARSDQVVMSCFDANEAGRATDAVGRIAAGQNVALLSEAGTPLVSDPGFRVVTAVIDAGLLVQPIPGPSAILAALVGSGQSPDRFTFLGFPPRKSGARRRLFETMRLHPFTLVLYESPLRTADTLEDLAAVFGTTRLACVARELTKTHEEFVRGTLGALCERYRVDRPLGEITLVVAGASPDVVDADHALSDGDLADRAAVLLAAGQSARDVTDELTMRSNRPRREIYAIVTSVTSGSREPPSQETD